jgi:hypothetical protein
MYMSGCQTARWALRTARLVSASVLGIAVLAACGGADAPPNAAENSTASTTTKPKSSNDRQLAIKGDTPSTGGSWGAPFDMKLVAIHMTMLPDGRVMYFGTDVSGTDQSGASVYAVWNPNSTRPEDGVELLPNTVGQDIFCSVSTLLIDGRVLVAGGDQPNVGNAAGLNLPNNQSLIFDPEKRQLSRRADLNRSRWYASAVTLMNGEVLLQGGAGGDDFPEVMQSDGKYRLLSSAPTGGLDATYPRNWIAPDGSVFGIAANKTYRLNPEGSGSISIGADLPAAIGGVSSVGNAMFRPGHIFALGGGGASASIDIRQSAPAFDTAEAVPGFHWYSVVTVLADGQLLRTGGGQTNDEVVTSQYRADIWNPVSR